MAFLDKEPTVFGLRTAHRGLKLNVLLHLLTRIRLFGWHDSFYMQVCVVFQRRFSVSASTHDD